MESTEFQSNSIELNSMPSNSQWKQFLEIECLVSKLLIAKFTGKLWQWFSSISELHKTQFTGLTFWLCDLLMVQQPRGNFITRLHLINQLNQTHPWIEFDWVWLPHVRLAIKKLWCSISGVWKECLVFSNKLMRSIGCRKDVQKANA